MREGAHPAAAQAVQQEVRRQLPHVPHAHRRLPHRQTRDRATVSRLYGQHREHNGYGGKCAPMDRHGCAVAMVQLDGGGAWHRVQVGAATIMITLKQHTPQTHISQVTVSQVGSMGFKCYILACAAMQTTARIVGKEIGKYQAAAM